MNKLVICGLLLVPMVAIAEEKRRILHHHPILFNMLQRNNSIRKRVGLKPHRINPALTKAAQDHANYMARTGQFSHYVNNGPQGRASKHGFKGGVRENIAYGTKSVDGAFNMWKNSGGHYASIISSTAEAGFGYAVSSSGLAYWVGVYGTPPSNSEVGETEEEVAKAIEEEKTLEALEAKTEPNEKSAETNLDQ